MLHKDEKKFTKHEEAMLELWRKLPESQLFEKCKFHELDTHKIEFMQDQIDTVLLAGNWKGGATPQELKDLLEDIKLNTSERALRKQLRQSSPSFDSWKKEMR